MPHRVPTRSLTSVAAALILIAAPVSAAPRPARPPAAPETTPAPDADRPRGPEAERPAQAPRRKVRRGRAPAEESRSQPPSGETPPEQGVEAAGGAEPRRGRRRGIEEAPAPSAAELKAREVPQMLQPFTAGCSVRRQPTFVKRLLSLRHTHPILSLEIWGDLRDYRDGQRVLFFARVPLRSYLTLFWIGPDGDVFVAFDNVPLPAHRDTMIDPDAVIVPPLGHERWVAIATLEPVPFTCGLSEAGLQGYLTRALALPHAIGRWEVFSKQPARL